MEGSWTQIMTAEQEKLIDDYIAHFFPEEGVKCECDWSTGVKCKFARFTPEMWEPLTVAGMGVEK